MESHVEHMGRRRRARARGRLSVPMCDCVFTEGRRGGDSGSGSGYKLGSNCSNPVGLRPERACGLTRGNGFNTCVQL